MRTLMACMTLLALAACQSTSGDSATAMECCAKKAEVVAMMPPCCRGPFEGKEPAACCKKGIADPAAKGPCCKKAESLAAQIPACCRLKADGKVGDCCKAAAR